MWPTPVLRVADVLCVGEHSTTRIYGAGSGFREDIVCHPRAAQRPLRPVQPVQGQGQVVSWRSPDSSLLDFVPLAGSPHDIHAGPSLWECLSWLSADHLASMAATAVESLGGRAQVHDVAATVSALFGSPEAAVVSCDVQTMLRMGGPHLTWDVRRQSRPPPTSSLEASMCF